MSQQAEGTGIAQIWFTTAEAAAAIGKASDTLVRWAKDGRIPDESIRPLPRGYLFHRDWLLNPVVFKYARKEGPQIATVRTEKHETAQGANRI